MGPLSPKDLKPGDFVKVEADRGEDLGIIYAVMGPDGYFREQTYLASINPKEEEISKEIKLILRLASTYEKRQLPGKNLDEAQVLQSCHELNNIYMLPMIIVDVEFQYDRHKLTIYYESGR